MRLVIRTLSKWSPRFDLKIFLRGLDMYILPIKSCIMMCDVPGWMYSGPPLRVPIMEYIVTPNQKETKGNKVIKSTVGFRRKIPKVV